MRTKGSTRPNEPARTAPASPVEPLSGPGPRQDLPADIAGLRRQRATARQFVRAVVEVRHCRPRHRPTRQPPRRWMSSCSARPASRHQPLPALRLQPTGDDGLSGPTAVQPNRPQQRRLRLAPRLHDLPKTTVNAEDCAGQSIAPKASLASLARGQATKTISDPGAGLCVALPRSPQTYPATPRIADAAVTAAPETLANPTHMAYRQHLSRIQTIPPNGHRPALSVCWSANSELAHAPAPASAAPPKVRNQCWRTRPNSIEARAKTARQ